MGGVIKSGDTVFYTGEVKCVKDPITLRLMNSELIAGHAYVVFSKHSMYDYFMVQGNRTRFWSPCRCFVLDYNKYLTDRYGFI